MQLRTKLVIILIFLSGNIFSQIAPKYSNEFLAIGIGGRALAMGNSVVAGVNDITGIYWNPAGILNNERSFEIGGMHSEYFAGIAKYDFIGGTYKVDGNSAIGLSMIRFGVDDIPNTLDLIDSDGNIRYDRISSFSVADYAFLFSYARKSPIEGLNYGANIKLIRRKAGEFGGAWGFGFDVGTQYYLGNWRFGLMARDITSTFNAWSFNTETFEDVFLETGNEIPENGLELTLPKLLVGAGYIFIIKEKFSAYPELGFDVTFDGKRNTVITGDPISIDPHFGVELGYNNLVFVRGGVGNFQNIPEFDNSNSLSWQPNMGVGVQFRGLKIDYAFTDIGDQSIAQYSHVFSLSYRFDLKTKNPSL
jgi:hypothetical protein